MEAQHVIEHAPAADEMETTAVERLKLAVGKPGHAVIKAVSAMVGVD